MDREMNIIDAMNTLTLRKELCRKFINKELPLSNFFMLKRGIEEALRWAEESLSSNVKPLNYDIWVKQLKNSKEGVGTLVAEMKARVVKND